MRLTLRRAAAVLGRAFGTATAGVLAFAAGCSGGAGGVAGGAHGGTTYHLYFLGGQSNMEGFGYVSEL